MSREQVYAQALRLSRADRYAIAYAILRSLESEESHASFDGLEERERAECRAKMGEMR